MTRWYPFKMQSAFVGNSQNKFVLQKKLLELYFLQAKLAV